MDRVSGLYQKNLVFLKSKFFLARGLIYFSFLLVPILIEKSNSLNQIFKYFSMWPYILFMIGQWFLLGKEIDYRLKIYYKINSSIDRIVYRLHLGMLISLIYFNLMALLPASIIQYFFWGTWVISGLFYSWPTRGKIIKESVSTHLYEYKYLDKFEKTLLLLSFIMFVVSVPQIPAFLDIEAIKLYLDPHQSFNGAFWNFTEILLYPFINHPEIYRLGLFSFFYLIGSGGLLLTFYAFMRYFVSRRSAILAVFALLSSWSFSKILANNLGDAIFTTFSLVWIWSLMWSVKSSTYRSGLYLGLVGVWGVLINIDFFYIFVAQLLLIQFIFLSKRTNWYKRQFFKYVLFGFIIALVIFIFNQRSFLLKMPSLSMFEGLWEIVDRKAFFVMSFLGVPLFLIKTLTGWHPLNEKFILPQNRAYELLFYILSLMALSLFLPISLLKSFTLMWMITFFSILPLELIFQSIRKLRSKRNMIYLVYILICLLDSHFEGRVKILMRLID